jgi:CubicO group peptidase (beta-lactamase class C family)
MISGTRSGLAQSEPPDAERPSASELVAIRQAAEEFMRRYQAPGLSLAISRHGHVVCREAFGMADTQSQERLTVEHRFRIASVSKPITSAAVFTLIERGALRLSDRVFGVKGILGNTYEPPPGSTWLGEITVEHLLTHTAGGWTNDRDDPMFREPQLDQAGLIAWTIKHQPLKTRPGTTYAYSNFGYCLLGRVIEKVTGRSYETYVRDTVLQRAGIRDMTIAGNTLAERQPREVRYYALGSGDPYALNVRRMDSHGGWLATPADLVRFANHVDGFSPALILQPDTIRTMTTASRTNPEYAKGWSVNSTGNWWHTGALAGTASILVRTRSRFCWAALVNAGAGRSPITDDLDRLMWTIVRRVPRWGA